MGTSVEVGVAAKTLEKAGDKPGFKVPVFDLSRQNAELHDEIFAALERVIGSGHFILGEEVEAFEAEIARLSRVRYAIGVGNCSDALHLVQLALGIGIGPGDEVITTPFTFFATAGGTARLGARPVFVDIDPVTFNIDPARVEAAITPRTRAIIPVHLYGLPADLPALRRVADRHGLVLIQDAAQALGARVAGVQEAGQPAAGAQVTGAPSPSTLAGPAAPDPPTRRSCAVMDTDTHRKPPSPPAQANRPTPRDLAGRSVRTPVGTAASQALGGGNDAPIAAIGDVTCYSFFPTKNLGAFGDGGMIVTDSAELAERLRMLRAHGSKPKYYHHLFGYNSRLDALHAAVLRAKLPYLPAWIERRRAIAARYRLLLADTCPVRDGLVELPAEAWPAAAPAQAPAPEAADLAGAAGAGHAYHVYHQFTIRVRRPYRDALR
ncbi:MAG TPA: aminotransferase class V-fold PLP-dependent enzyme [Firmicutes bacterium]|nr:aminotransferase class V-fold PLP-dependent enzyme [Bacillota bacterium]